MLYSWQCLLMNLKESLYVSKIAKEAQDIIEITHEKTKTTKNSKLLMLISRFEEIKMLEYESLNEFYAKLNDIVNSKFNIREKIEYS